MSPGWLISYRQPPPFMLCVDDEVDGSLRRAKQGRVFGHGVGFADRDGRQPLHVHVPLAIPLAEVYSVIGIQHIFEQMI